MFCGPLILHCQTRFSKTTLIIAGDILLFDLTLHWGILARGSLAETETKKNNLGSSVAGMVSSLQHLPCLTPHIGPHHLDFHDSKSMSSEA